VEIKSSDHINEEDLSSLHSLKRDYPKSQFFCLSNQTQSQVQNGVEILHWKKGIQELGFA